MKKYIGIVGHGSDKFTERGKSLALLLIKQIFADSSFTENILVSGHSPVGGIDIWAEEIANELNITTDIKRPKQNRWDAEYGYKARNIDIAETSNEVHVIVVDDYPLNYKGMLFNECYHCHSNKHVKSGGCWTGRYAEKIGKHAIWHIIKNDN